jgi:hypothetical protein
MEVLASVVIIFDNVSEGRSERNDGNPARIIPTISSFFPGIEESRVLAQRIAGLVLRTEDTTERAKKGTHNRRSHPLVSDHSTSGFYKWSRPLLTGSAPQTEFDITPRKQTPEKILTGAGTHISDLAIWRELR